MAYDSNRVKTVHLGMPYGTAMHKLRKNLVFHMAQRLGEDFCFKCGNRIETAEELSIEHKAPWLHSDEALFWDMDNIAFSHRVCNRPDRLIGKQPQDAPPGTAWCCGCQAFMEVCHFAKNRTRWNGLQNYCRVCWATYRRKRDIVQV